jgi:hypothetical protein
MENASWNKEPIWKTLHGARNQYGKRFMEQGTNMENASWSQEPGRFESSWFLIPSKVYPKSPASLKPAGTKNGNRLLLLQRLLRRRSLVAFFTALAAVHVVADLGTRLFGRTLFALLRGGAS